jgi:hypothetical protein
MTGDLVIDKSTPRLTLDAAVNTTNAEIVYKHDDKTSWYHNASKDFYNIYTTDALGEPIQPPAFSISRATNHINVPYPTAADHIATKQYADNVGAGKVAKTGDEMSGGLTIRGANPALAFKKTAAEQHNQILGMHNETARWLMSIGDPAPETGSHAGSNFTIHRYGDDGTYFDAPFSINRATAEVKIPGQITGQGGSVYGSGVHAVGNLACNGNVFIGGTACYFNIAGSYYIYRPNPTEWHTDIGILWHTGNFNPASYQPALGYTPVQQGGGAYQYNSKVYIGWDGTGLRAQVDATDLGRLVREWEVGAYVQSLRMAHIADRTHAVSAGLEEPYGASCFTGIAMYSDASCVVRYRQIQLYTANGGWFAAYYS